MRLALALGCVLVVAGCGDDGGDDDPIDAGGDVIDAAANDVDSGSTGQAPTASFTVTPDCTMNAQTGIDFASTSTDPDGDTLTCMWTFASATNSPIRNECSVTGVTFPHFNPYPCTLVVDDGNGNTDMTTINVAPCN
jgi:hypothetical protein